ncbi:Ephrin type-B receptor 3 [Taenia solium]|eukprot:TsM_000136700 transcript=TsM_000136700 gene=TsM_000136700
MEYRNALFQAGQTAYHQLLTIDSASIEMKKPLGKSFLFIYPPFVQKANLIATRDGEKFARPSITPWQTDESKLQIYLSKNWLQKNTIKLPDLIKSALPVMGQFVLPMPIWGNLLIRPTAMATLEGRHGETFLGLLKPSPPSENNALPARKVFLRPALPTAAIKVAEIAASIRHPRVVLCHGLLKAVEPHLLVYDFMALGRLDKFLISEIGRFEVSEEHRKSPSWPRSPLLSTKTVFHMLHQIASAFAFLVSLSIDNLRLDSSSVLVSSDYSCKVQLKTWPPEVMSKGSRCEIEGADVGRSLADFMDVRPSSPRSKVFLIQDGQHILLPSILKPPIEPSPSRVFESIIRNLKSSGSEDSLATNSMLMSAATVVKNLGWLQVELLLASVLCQRCMLDNSATSSSNVSEKIRRILRHLEWGEALRLRENILTLIARWFGNDFLGCMLSSCVDQETSRRPGLMEVVNHLQNYLTDGDTKSQKGKITAVIHGDGIISL